MASVFSALGSLFNVVTDSCDAMSSGISNFRKEQQVDHAIDNIKRKERLVKEFRKEYANASKSLSGISDPEKQELNRILEELGMSKV